MSRKLDVVTLTGEEYDALELDAERYRWLRINSTKPAEPWSTHTPESFDKMVDEEMARRNAAGDIPTEKL